MKLTITTTYKAQRMTIKELLKQDYGWFIESVNEEPARISDNRYWLHDQNQRRVVYHLTEEDSKAVLK